jgi:hypothetical protein
MQHHRHGHGQAACKASTANNLKFSFILSGRLLRS